MSSQDMMVRLGVLAGSSSPVTPVVVIEPIFSFFEGKCQNVLRGLQDGCF